MKIKAIAAAVVVLLGTAGCTDLLVEPKSAVSGAKSFEDPAAYRAFLAKLYAGLSLTGQQGPAGSGDIQGIDEGFSSYLRQYWQMQELPTDEAIIGWGDAGLPELNSQLWSSSNQFFAAMYSRIFFQVAMANEFLRETTDEKLAARGQTADALIAEVRQFRAEARFLRALSYWHGLDLFGNIPLVTEDFPLGTTPPEQRTRAEIFTFIEQELNEIEADLPAPGAGEYGRADQGALLMLRAKLYMNAGVYVGQDRYADALAAVDALIRSGAYMLDDDYQHIFLADNHTSPEIIFALPADGEHAQTFGGMTYLTHAPVGGSMNPADYGVDFGWGGPRARPEVVALFEAGPDGLPTSGPDARGHLFYTDGHTLTIQNVSDFTNGYAYVKYRNVTSTGEPGSRLNFPDTDFPMFRLADAYLMYAEAVLRGGGGSRAQALAYVNALRERAYGDTSGNITDAELDLDLILAERARELMWEAHRRSDLIRYGLFTGGEYVWSWKGGVEAGTATADHLALYPIPETELLLNPGLEQNPGY
ncbi:MAG TPA: RagB/SusD family nutrient uptake outer membrane protein [Longimicrobiales bacterium]